MLNQDESGGKLMPDVATVLPVVHRTFVIERTYAHPPEKVFAAFADPDKKRRWYADRELVDVDEFSMDFRVGGVDHACFRFREGTPFPGVQFTNISTYQDIILNTRIVTAYTMAFGDKRFSSSQSTFEFVSDGSGTRLVFTEQAAFFEGADGPQRREEGWHRLLTSLTAALEN
jgi:uncharacterized protein YndB with AHSA1/START domain